jgi:acetyl esterase
LLRATCLPARPSSGFTITIGGATRTKDFRYAPLITQDLSRLPPALVIVGECDPLRDDGIAYAERLKSEGNEVELTNYLGMVHPFFSMGGAVDAGRRAVTQAASALKRVFGGH